MDTSDETRLSDRTVRAAPATVLRVGDLVAGRYELRGVLGRGGMGVVYEAEDRELAIPVALKALHPERACDDQGLRALKREVLLARRVTHANVCRLYDLGRDAERDVLFCTMELVRGETLAQRIARLGRIPPSQALPLVRQLARGLDAAHAAGVVHRDFKSGNVLIEGEAGERNTREKRDTSGERAVVTDFGIAVPLRVGPAAVASDADISGTPAYMAPEQLRGEAAGPAADVYALGVVLFEMVTGRVPFGEAGLVSAVIKLEVDAPSPRDDVPDLPRAWEDTILRCLARRPDARFASAGDAVAALAGGTTIVRRARPPARLPAESDAFVARDEELADLGDRLATGSRLLTILGPPGTGKTRLALHHAQMSLSSWPGGAWFCDLRDARSLDGIATAVATALDVPLGKGDGVEQLGHAIAGRGRCLIVFDNFEQVVGFASASVGAWRARAADATFLVTSRERLHLPGEEVLPLGPLAPAAAEELFLARGAVHRPGFAPDGEERAQVRRVVEGLEGLPLAIELAAARLRVMTPRQIAERLSDRFRLLAAGPRDTSRRTLRAAIDASWELLVPWEQAAFAQYSVFEGGFTLEAAEAVVDLASWPEAPWVVDVIQALLDKSLLRLEAPGPGVEPRFGMLVSLQDYAREKLDADDVRRAQSRHGEFFARLGSEQELGSLERHGGVGRRRRLAREIDNIVAACRRAVARGDGEVAVATFRAAWAVLDITGPFDKGAALGDEVLALADLAPVERARALRAQGLALGSRGRTDDARKRLDAALAIAEEIGDRHLAGLAHGSLGPLHAQAGRMDEARGHLEHALAIAREVGDRRLEGTALGNLGFLEVGTGHMDAASALFEQALAIHRDVGNRRYEGIALANIGLAHVTERRMDEARTCFEQVVELAREVGDRRLEGVVLSNLGMLQHHEGHLDEARGHYERALAIHRQTADRRAEGSALLNLGTGYQAQGRLAEAWTHGTQALAILREVNDRPLEAIVVGNLGNLHEAEGRLDAAREHYEQALAIHREVGHRRMEGLMLGSIASIDARSGRIAEAREGFAAGERVLRESDGLLELGSLLCQRGEMEARSGDSAAARASLDAAASLAAQVGAGPESPLGRDVSALRDLLASHAAGERD